MDGEKGEVTPLDARNSAPYKYRMAENKELYSSVAELPGIGVFSRAASGGFPFMKG